LETQDTTSDNPRHQALNQIMMSNFRKHFGEDISSEVEENMGQGITLFEPLTNHKIRIVHIINSHTKKASN
jgi:hypothetical protein